MWDLEIGGITSYNLLNWFFIYSFFGWIWKVPMYRGQKNDLSIGDMWQDQS